MSINPETDLNLDELFQPSWAKGSDSKNPYAKYEPKERPDHGDRRGRDRFRRDARGERRPPRGEKGPRPKGGGKRHPYPDRRETPPPLPEVNVSLHAEKKGAESLARQIKTTGRAYPLFDIARMILQKPERYCAVFAVKKAPDGTVAQPLFACALDQSVWLSVDEALAHVLRHHLATFYKSDRTETEPPKGTYTFVAQCGMSGTIFGPPNHHDYQAKLREFHSKRFSHLPFETYKARVKIVRDEAVVKQWVEDQSWKTEYICLNVAEETRLMDMAAVEAHFREVHLPTIITQVETHTLPGTAIQSLRGPTYRAYRAVFDQQRRFPMQVATSLSQQFAALGLQFFKVNKSVTHVWVARPTFLDLDNEPVSDSVKGIVHFINEHPKCTRRQLIETLAPSPRPPVPPEPAESSSETEESKPSKPDPAATDEPTPEQAAIIGDLHWLIHQGHVIEFANGLLETAKKPAPRPTPKPAKPKTEKHEAPAAKPQKPDPAPPAETPGPKAAEAESAPQVPPAATETAVPVDPPGGDTPAPSAPPPEATDEPATPPSKQAAAPDQTTT